MKRGISYWLQVCGSVLVDYIFTLVMSLEKCLVVLDKKVISR